MKRLHDLHTKDAPHRYCNRKDREECIHIVLFPFGRSIQVCEDFFFPAVSVTFAFPEYYDMSLQTKIRFIIK